ncbi:hypothetical protein Bca101_020880 [Brassica carinata]
MDSLPGHLLDKVLFKTDLRALAMLCCTNTSLQSHIQNPSFVSEYYSQIKSNLLHISSFGSPYLVNHPPHDCSRSLRTKDVLRMCHILGCCSGLLILFIDGRLCVTNPVRKIFRFLTLSNRMRYPTRGGKINQLGLAVNQTDRTTQKQARLIQIDFPQGLTSRTLFAHGVNSLSLVSWKEEIIYVYALKNILSDPNWVLVKQIQIRGIDKNRVDWYVEAYNGKCLVLQSFYNGGVVPVDDLIANKWEVMCSVPIWCDANRDFFLSTPSSSFVVGLDEILACGDRSISSLRLIMGLVDGSLSEKVEKQHGAMQIENTLYEQDTNKKRRVNVLQVNQNGSRLRPDFRVTVDGEQLKSVQGVCFGDNLRSQSQASHHSENLDASYSSGETVWYPLWLATCEARVAMRMSVSKSLLLANLVLSLDIFCKLRRKIIGEGHGF